MSVHIIVYAAPGSIRDEYVSRVETEGARCSAVGDSEGLRALLASDEISGVLLDIPTVIRTDSAGKSLLRDVAHLYPTARLRFDSKTGEVLALCPGRPPAGIDDPLSGFIAVRCGAFSPRKIRGSHRASCSLNVILSRTPEVLFDEAEKTVITNVSEDGCFVFTKEKWDEGRAAFLRVMEMSDPTPLPAEVFRIVSWGSPLQMPGIGCRFVGVSPERLASLRDLLSARPSDFWVYPEGESE